MHGAHDGPSGEEIYPAPPQPSGTRTAEGEAHSGEIDDVTMHHVKQFRQSLHLVQEDGEIVATTATPLARQVLPKSRGVGENFRVGPILTHQDSWIIGHT